MAKPLNPYQNAAPSVMSQMGAGILEAGARIGKTIESGYEDMGKGIASGIDAAADAYKEYKDDQAKFDATKKMYDAFGGSFDDNTRKKIDGIFADTSMSVREKNALAPTLMQYLGASNQQQQALAKQKQELDARAGLQTAGDAAQNWREIERIKATRDENAMKLLYGGSGGGSTSFGGAPAGSGNSFMPQQFTLPSAGAYGQQLPTR